MKTCRLCSELKPLDQFHKATAMRDGHRNECKPCWALENKKRYNKEVSVARANAWRAANPERYLETQRKIRERKKDFLQFQQFCYRFKLTDEACEHWWALRYSPCGICNEIPEKPHFDHDHATGRPRGWLCQNCNFGLGHFKDNIQSLESAINWLKN